MSGFEGTHFSCLAARHPPSSRCVITSAADSHAIEEGKENASRAFVKLKMPALLFLPCNVTSYRRDDWLIAGGKQNHHIGNTRTNVFYASQRMMNKKTANPFLFAVTPGATAD